MQKKITLNVEGMTCKMCAQHVTKALGGVSGVENVQVDSWQKGKALISGQEDVNPEDLVSAVEKAGYEAVVAEEKERPRGAGNGRADDEQDYDLAVIGGGSAAFAAAIGVSEKGGRVVIINKGLPIGGTCVNVGCVPSKTLIRTAEAHHRSTHHNFAGISSDSQVVDFKAIIDQKRQLVKSLRREKYIEAVQDDSNISLLKGRGRLTGEHTVEVNGETIRAGNILIATGSSSSAPPIPGLEEAGYLTNAEAYELDELPGHLIVLGGGYIGLENAQLFSRLGSKVTIVEQVDQILPNEQKYLAGALEEHLRKEGITVRTSARVKSVNRANKAVAVEIDTGGQTEIIEGTHILVATGRQGNTKGLGLEAVGLETSSDEYLKVDDTLRTSVPSVFGAGDVIGDQQFVYTAAYEGQLVARNALNGANEARDYSALPWVVFTDPQVAGVGMDEKEAQKAGIDAEVTELSLEDVPRALAARDTRGFIRLIRNRANDRLVGARILAPEGSELLMEVTMAIKYGITVEEIASTLHPYLTLSEGIKLAALTFTKDVKKLSCCAG